MKHRPSPAIPIWSPLFWISALLINGNQVAIGPDYGRGQRRSSYGKDLMIWTRLSTRGPMTLSLERK